MVTRFVMAALAAALLAGCASSSRFDSYASTSAVQDETAVVQQPMTLSAEPMGDTGPWQAACTGKRCSLGLTLRSEDTAWLQVFTANEAAGMMSLGFVVPIQAKEAGFVSVENDSGTRVPFKLGECTQTSCRTARMLSREQKDKLLSGAKLHIYYALNDGVNKEFVIPSSELKARLAKL